MAPPLLDSRQDIGVLTPEDNGDAALIADYALKKGDLVSSAADAVKHAEDNQGTGPGGSSAFRFVVVDHPDRLKDKREMRENRMHVMHDYLDKERRRPATRDPRLHGATRSSRGRVKLSGRNLRPTNFNCNSNQDTRLVDLARLTPAESIASDFDSQKASDEGVGRSATKRRAPALQSTTNNSTDSAAVARRTYELTKDKQRFVAGMGGRFEHSNYAKATLENIPARLGGQLEPFGTWPSFSDPSLNIGALKWSCSQRFGSHGLSVHWIPSLLRARHAFLSTLCISSAHDAIMSRALRPSATQTWHESMQRWKIKKDVIAMVGESMNDPEMQTADETIIAILHLLNSDIMGCDDRDMRIHQTGLHNMICQRGGLSNLGVGGQLASVLTGTMYLVAVLRETVPHHDFVNFASSQDTSTPSDLHSSIPESPVYCRSSGFHTIRDAITSETVTYKLLDTLRLLTMQFVNKNSSKPASMIDRNLIAGPVSRHESIENLHDQLMTFAPGRDLDFGDMNERYMYETIRLTAIVYASALLKNIPFSRASEQLSSRPRYLTEQQNQKEGASARIATPMPRQIKHALMRTDTSFCWDHMAGVLFWVALVAGAAGNPGPLAEDERYGEDEDARKFLTAIAVRCCIVMSFEYGSSILGTLKRLLAIERTLDVSEMPNVTDKEVATIFPSTEKTSGPSRPPQMQKGFMDFAEEFLSI